MKKTIKVISLVLLFSFAASCLFSCKGNGGERYSNKEKFTQTFYEYFDTVTTVVGYAESKGEFLRVLDVIEARFSEYHKLYDAYNSSLDPEYEKSYAGITNIKDINALVNGKHIERKVDKKIIDLLLYSKEVYELTNGETNIAMGSVLSLWHNERDKAAKDPTLASVPTEEALRQAAEHTDINDIIIDTENSTVFLSDPEMTIDVGAVAKGYATERIIRELESMGIVGYAISAGGNVSAIGTKPNGQKWSIGIENPLDPLGEYVEKLSIENKSVVTSGSYQRFYTVGGKRYHHIIDKDTLYPSEYFISVSVITKDSALADALSTALFSMPLDAGLQFVEGMSGVEAIWVMSDGTKHTSSGFEAFIFK